MPERENFNEWAQSVHSAAKGLLEKTVMKIVSRLSFTADSRLRVDASASGTYSVQPASGAVFSMSYGLMTNTASTYQDSMNSFQAGFRRNLIKT